MHTMLMRRVPFDGKKDQDIINNILSRPLNFHHQDYAKLTVHCLDLLKAMLFKDEKNRIDAKGVFNHIWL